MCENTKYDIKVLPKYRIQSDERTRSRKKSKKMMLREVMRFIKSCLNNQTPKNIASSEMGQFHYQISFKLHPPSSKILDFVYFKKKRNLLIKMNYVLISLT